MASSRKMIPNLSRTKSKRVEHLGEARRGILMALGTAGIMSSQEADLLRIIVDRIQKEAEGLVGEAASGLLDASSID